MKAFAIVIKGHDVSEKGYRGLETSAMQFAPKLELKRFDAIIPNTVKDFLSQHKLKWNYPDQGSVLCPWTELRKAAYGGRDPLARVACSASHFALWEKSVESDQPIMILEHDSIFVAPFDPEEVATSGILGINDPRGATFASEKYHQQIQANSEEIQPVPVMASKEVPQGLAGNSAYIITPSAAAHLIALCYKYGLWPNDAIMCRQLCDFLTVSRTYYTQIQGLKSTTST